MSPPAKRGSTNTREKDIMLDKDMGKDDFSSWSLKSQDDPMDFGFELPGNNKKNAFKLDMGFDLDGDFGKLSSFKMDMPDFDFSTSPPEKATKAKESSDDKSSGNFRQKKDLFAFSYDFDALDGFDLDSSPPKKGSETTTKTMDCEEIAAGRKTEKSEAFDFDLDLPITRQAVFMASTDVKVNASSEKDNQNSKTSDTQVVDNSTSSKHATLESMENSKAVESPQSPRKNNSQTHTICLQPQSADTSSLKTSCPMVEEIDEPCPSNETSALSPSHASEAVQTAVNRESSPDIEESRSSIIKGNCPRDSDQHAYDKMICTPGSSYEKPEPDISAQLCLDMTEQQQEEMGTDKAEIGDESKREQCDPDIRRPQTTPSGKISLGTRPSQTSLVQDSSAKLPLALSTSLQGVKDLKAMQNKDSGLIRSRFFKKPEKPESRVLESSPTRTESRPVTQERIGLILNPTMDTRRDMKDVLPGSKTRACPVELVNMDSENNAAKDKTSNSHEKIIHKDHSNAKTVENVVGQLDRSKLQAKNTTKERSILQLNSSSKLDISSLTQKLSTNLGSGAEPVQKAKLLSLERPKLINIMSDLRGSKTQRNNRVNTNQPCSPLQPEVTSSINKEINVEPPIIKSSEMLHNFLHRPLKRKALDEDADESIKPQLKRVSISPRETRNVGIIVQTEFSNQETKTDNTTKELISGSPRTIINMAKLDIPITETDDNVEKAEGYTKQLENICNSLRKKHEEVKELIVRAVVNNNTLLMLNHPSYEDKILKLQKFAAKLTSEKQYMLYTPTTVA